MIPGYKKFQPPPLATSANPATKLPEGSKGSRGSNPAEVKTWVFGLFPDDREERAAVYQFDAGMSRAEAERRAGLLN